MHTAVVRAPSLTVTNLAGTGAPQFQVEDAINEHRSIHTAFGIADTSFMKISIF